MAAAKASIGCLDTLEVLHSFSYWIIPLSIDCTSATCQALCWVRGMRVTNRQPCFLSPRACTLSLSRALGLLPGGALKLVCARVRRSPSGRLDSS